MDDAEAGGDVVILDEAVDDNAYLAANHTILDATVAWMNELHQPGSAVLVWDGISTGDRDFTEKFGA